MNKFILSIILLCSIGSMTISGCTNYTVHPYVVKECDQSYIDADITQRVQGAFVRERLLTEGATPATLITIKTVNRIVYLGGTADNQAQVYRAVSVAAHVSGVQRVESRIWVVNAIHH